MYHTGEIRWFFRDGPRTEVARWFSDCDTAIAEPARIDRYIILPRCDTAGVKIRQGNIEVKAQTQPAELVSFSKRVSGHQGTWVKWSRPVTDPDSFFAAPLIPERWAHVEKARNLRLLSLLDETPGEVAPGSRHLAQGEEGDHPPGHPLTAAAHHPGGG